MITLPYLPDITVHRWMLYRQSFRWLRYNTFHVNIRIYCLQVKPCLIPHTLSTYFILRQCFLQPSVVIHLHWRLLCSWETRFIEPSELLLLIQGLILIFAYIFKILLQRILIRVSTLIFLHLWINYVGKSSVQFLYQYVWSAQCQDGDWWFVLP